MNDKFISILEGLDEGFAGEIAKGNKVFIKKTGPSTHSAKTLEMAKAMADKVGYKGKIKKDGDMFTFVTEAEEEELDEGRGRPKKAVDPDAPVKEKGKRGRPKKSDVYKADDEDDESEEGKRDLKLMAYISAGKGSKKKETTDSKIVKGASPDDIKKLVQDFENQMIVKYGNKWDVDEDDVRVSIKDNLGWSGAKAEDQTKDDSGSDAEDDEYSIGKK
jgi:hypothetical protein